MKRLMETFVTVLCLLLTLQISYGQQAEAPTYKEGDWWRVKVQVSYPGGLSRTPLCEEMYPEYVVKVAEGKLKVYGVDGNAQRQIDCLSVEAQLLGSGPESRDFLKFPLSVGRSWTFRYLRSGPGTRAAWVNVERKVVSRETINTAKGELEVFKIEGNVSGQYVETYFYSSKAKAIVLFKRPTPAVDRTVTLVDFNVSQ